MGEDNAAAAALWERLGIRPGLTALIGSGGKTTLLHLLGRELCRHGRVILTTSTHIRPSQEVPCLLSPTEAQLRAALDAAPLVCVGSLTAEGKLTACALPWQTLTALADYVLVEADGSRQLPLKAHAPYEPVIPPGCGSVVCLVGAGGLGQPIAQAVHRPERFCALTGAAPEDAAAPALVAQALNREALADRYYLNQCDLPGAAAAAKQLAALLDRPALCGSLWAEENRDGTG